MIETTKRTRSATMVLAGGLLLYLPLFFASWPRRLESFSLLLLPDQILLSWLGHRPSDFGMVHRLPILAVAIVILLAAYAVGRDALEFVFRIRGLSRGEACVFSLAIGLNVWSLLTLLFGLAGWLNASWLLRGLVAAALGSLGYRGYRRYCRHPQDARAATPPPGWLPRGFVWLAAPFLLLILLGGMLPPWEFDVREYHLQVPKEWYQAGRIDFLPHNVYGNMPMGAEMHALLAMVLIPGEDSWWWGAMVGKTLIACFAPLTALALFAAGQRLAGRNAGLVAALVYLSIPWIAHVSVTGLIEGVLGFYTFLALYAALLWCRPSVPPSPAATRLNHAGGLLLAGFLAGSAAACKYPGLLFVVAPTLLVVLSARVGWGHRSAGLGRRDTPPQRDARPVAGRPSRRVATARRSAVTAAIFLTGVLCACGPWYLKNAWQSGNPIYPLVFGGPGWTVQRMEQWNRAHRVPVDSQGRRYTLRQAGAAVAEFGWRDHGQSLLVLPLAVMAAWCGRPRRWVLSLALYATFFLAAWWLVTHRIDRFYVPLLPVLCLLAGLGAAAVGTGADRAGDSGGGFGRRLVMATLVVGMCLNLLLMLTADNQDHRYLVALPTLREDPPREGGISRVHPAHRYLNQHRDTTEVVLLVGDAQPFDLEVPNRYNTCFDENVFQRLLQGRTRQQRWKALRAERISHVFVDWNEIDRYRRPGNYGFTDFVTRRLVRDELVAQQGLLRPVPLPLNPQAGELFEVLGIREIDPE